MAMKKKAETAGSVLNFSAYDKFEKTPELDWAFPKVDPGIKPMGTRVLVQIRRPKVKSGRILLTSDQVEVDKFATQIGMVVAVGPVAFRDRNTLESWPEGAVSAGSFVRIPLYGKDQWEVPVDKDDKDKNLNALFCLINDYDISGVITADPMTIEAHK
jgi:co-chaperonin GroES (HSP10)